MFFIPSLLHAGQRVERLVPPVISEESIDEKVACTRPMRKGKFKISAEERDGKLITHIYGHGGAGCTTLFGSVAKGIEAFEKQLNGREAGPIRVIGSGIIGLTTAIELTLKGYKVAGIKSEERFDIPSLKNAGYFALVSVKTDPEEQENLNQIGMISFQEYKKISEGRHPYLKKQNARLLPVYASLDTEAGVEDLEVKGLIPEKELVTLDFGNGVTHPNFVKYQTFFMDTTNIMLELRETVEKFGIPIEEVKVNSFDEISEDFIFNCAGLGSKTLNDDDEMVAVRGHLLNLNYKSGTEHMDYMIYTKVQGRDGDEYVYMFPKGLQVDKSNPFGKSVRGTIGGTFIPNTDELAPEELEVLDRVEFEKLKNRTNVFFWGTESSPPEEADLKFEF